MLSNRFILLFVLFPSFPHPLCPSAAPLWALHCQSEASRSHFPKLDLEHWYQELMAGSSQLWSPPLPAKSLSGRRPVLQVEALLSPLHPFAVSVCKPPALTHTWRFDSSVVDNNAASHWDNPLEASWNKQDKILLSVSMMIISFNDWQERAFIRLSHSFF